MTNVLEGTGGFARSRLRGLAALALVAGAVFGISTPAAAHAELVQATPAPLSDVQRAPTKVQLEFSEHLTTSAASIRVFSASGQRVDSGVITSPSSSTIAVGLEAVGRGGYLVAWSIISEDGHPVKGSYTFQVLHGDQISPETARSLSKRVDDLTLPNLATGLARALALLSILLLGAWMMLRFLGANGHTASWFLGVAAAAAVLSGAAQLAGMAGAITGSGMSGFVRASALRAALETSAGTAAAVRAFVPAILTVIVRIRPNHFPTSWMRGGLAVAAMAVTSAEIGHAASGRYQELAFASQTLHWGLVALWCGGLLALRVQWSRWTDEQRAHATALLSPVFLASVAAIVGTGIFQAWRMLPDLEALGSSRYGNMIAVKAVLLGVIVVIAAGNRGALKDLRWALSEAADLDSDVESVEEADLRRDIAKRSRSLMRGMTAELIIVLGIVSTTVVLAGTSPPHEAVTGQGTSVTATTSDQKYDVVMDIAPLRVGPNEIHITVASPSGVAPPTKSIRVSLEQPAHDIRNLAQRLLILGPGHVQTIGAHLAFPDRWNVIVTIRVDEFSESTAVIPIDIP